MTGDNLLCIHRGRRYGFEVKRADAPTLTPSMRIATSDLELERLTVIYPGRHIYKLAPGVSTLPAQHLVSLSWDQVRS